MHTELLESTSKSSDFSSENQSEEEMNEEAAAWTSKNGRIVWSPTNTKTLHYVLAATGFIPGPTHYAAARITDPISSFALFLTDEIMQHIVPMTNLMGDAQSKRGEIWTMRKSGLMWGC